MINGFDNETAPLSDKEMELLPTVIEILNGRAGKSKAVTNQQIGRAILLRKEVKIGGPRIRKIINYIRQNGLVSCLIANSAGYYVAETEQELIDYEESLDGRATAIWQIKNHIKEQREARFNQPTQGVLF